MIQYILIGHELQNDVQTMVQVFYPNKHYTRVEEIPETGITIVSNTEEHGVVAASVFVDGKIVRKWSVEYEGEPTEKDMRCYVKRTLYELLELETGISPQWGILTGVRPAKIVTELLKEGKSEEGCLHYLTGRYLVTMEKAELSIQVAKAEAHILTETPANQIGLYIGIPFCPTRCLYCSFTAYPLEQYKDRVDEYLDAMFKEMDYVSEYIKQTGQVLQSIYIGGGTPTSLTEVQLERLLKKVQGVFGSPVSEYTVEAGRPDTITKEKLQLMKTYHVNRISINPQTMNQKTLDAVGRKHTVDDICRVFEEARACGHDNINMDLILGLPNETPADVEYTMQQLEKLAPESVTVHTLAVKRASRLKEEFDQHTLTSLGNMEEMIEISSEYAEKMGMEPYYMYRQKNMVGNFENVGYCIPGKESVYNVQIMEERQTILAVGAGASTKTVDRETNHIDRVYNVKSVEDYIARIDEMIERKKDGLPEGGNV